MDKSLLIWINQGWSQPWLDTFFVWISNRGAFGFPLLLVIAALLIRRFGRPGMKLWLLVIVSIGAGDLIGNLLKHLLAQPRPCVELYMELRSPLHPAGQPCGGMASGMPSNHALNFFLCASVLGNLLRSWRWALPLGMIAALVGLSRIYLGVHYPSQVLAGATLGLLLGWLAARAAGRLAFVQGLHLQSWKH